MNKSMKWKERLLSSSLPLEFEVANFLAKEGFFLEPDYKYQRRTNELVKECSIDLEATVYFPITNPNAMNSALHLMVECKYRSPNKVCLFLPEILSRHALSNVTLGRTLCLIDEFSYDRIPQDAIYRFEEDIPVCYKGIDMDLSSGNVEDKEINEGIDQLMYSLPQMHLNSVTHNLTCHPADNKPYFAMSILVTNADLRILKPNVDIQKIQKARNINAISHSVPYLIFYRSHGDLFKRHLGSTLRNIDEYLEDKTISELEAKLRESKLEEYEFNYPRAIISECTKGYCFFFRELCHQFIICNSRNLPVLIKTVKRIIGSCLRKRRNFRE